MYCKNCGREIDADARFCPACGYDQSRVSGSSYRPVGAETGYDRTSVAEEKNGAMKLTLILTLVVSLILGLWGGVVILVIMLLYYALAKKADTDVVMGCIIGGVIGVIIGYVINFLVFAVLLSAMM